MQQKLHDKTRQEGSIGSLWPRTSWIEMNVSLGMLDQGTSAVDSALLPCSASILARSAPYAGGYRPGMPSLLNLEFQAVQWHRRN
jgi:hypothetical protein